MSLNIPDTRQAELAERLEKGHQIVAVDAASEYGVSIDTIRRDILALEADGKAKRVRGGAVPAVVPAEPLHARIADDPPINSKLCGAAIQEIGDAKTLLVDGGRTALRIVEELPQQRDRLVITPSPWVAIACQNKGIAVFLLGGSLRPQGGIATGELAVARVADVSVDVTVLGACGIDAEFGLSSDDHDEGQMKRAMHKAAGRTVVVTEKEKVGRRARHRTLPLEEIDVLISDINPEKALELRPIGTRLVLV